MRGGCVDGGSEDSVGFGGEEDLDCKGFEADEMGFWVRVVRDDLWGAVEEDVVMVSVGTV